MYAAKKAIGKMPLRTLRTGDEVSIELTWRIVQYTTLLISVDLAI